MPAAFHEWQHLLAAARELKPLGDDCVQVWLAEVPKCPADLAFATRLLSGSEQLRAQRFATSQARNEFIFGRALLRCLLATCLTVDPTQPAIGYGLHGKPLLLPGINDNDLRFNLAHSESLVAVAITRGRDVGIDIEWTKRPLDESLLAARAFSLNELCQLRALPPEQQRLAFFTGWTRKEAYLKATGEGLSDAISAVELAFPQNQPGDWEPASTPETAARKWKIRPIPLPDGFCGALVVEDLANPPSR